jgi:HSP20 family protein
MTLVRWLPFQEFDTMERRLRRMLDDIGFAPPVVPPADVYETPREYVFELEVPGFDEKTLSIELTDHTLVVKGEREEEKDEEAKAFQLHERLEKHFERRFRLPAEADTKHLAAEFKRGVLFVHAPKLAPVEKKTVAIKAT